MLGTVLVNDELLFLVGGMTREPRGHLVRHIGLREILDFVLAVPGDGVHQIVDTILCSDKDGRFGGCV